MSKNKINKEIQYRKFGTLSNIYLYISGTLVTIYGLLSSYTAIIPQNLKFEDPLVYFIGIFIVVLGLLIKEHQASRDISHSFHDILTRISDVNERLEIETYDSSIRANTALRNGVQSAFEVRNTVFRNSLDGINVGAGAPKPSEIFDAWLSSSAGSSWKEVVGPEEAFEDRFTVPPKGTIRGNKFREIHVLRHANRCPNFTLLRYHDDSLEVFWGWISRRDDGPEKNRPYAFSSKEDVIVNHFDALFDLLFSQKTWGKPIDLEYSSEKRDFLNSGEIIDKKGRWISFSVLEGGLNTFGIYDISIENVGSGRRGLVMKGLTFDKNLFVIEQTQHGDEEISHSRNQMFIQYGKHDQTSEPGFCFYDFEAGGGRLTGFFSHDRAENKNKIFGLKTKDSPPIPILPKGAKMPQDIVLEFQRVIPIIFADYGGSVESIKDYRNCAIFETIDRSEQEDD